MAGCADDTSAPFFEELPVPGLKVCRGGVPPELQEEVLCAVDSTLLADTVGNQAMCFGALPDFVERLIDHLRTIPGLLPAPLLAREPLFNQLIVNEYWAGEGLKAHVDLARFADGIVGVSLGSTCTMVFEHAQGTQPACAVVLWPGDVLSMSGEARYDWLHGIPSADHDVDEHGVVLERGRRVSLTLRRLGPNQLLDVPADAPHDPNRPAY